MVAGAKANLAKAPHPPMPVGVLSGIDVYGSRRADPEAIRRALGLETGKPTVPSKALFRQKEEALRKQFNLAFAKISFVYFFASEEASRAYITVDLVDAEDSQRLRFLPEPSGHMIILCNVLHEISPDSWPKLFQDIDALLSSDGVLVVMEDLLPPVGELPNERGYLLLDESGLGLLFDDPKGIKTLQKQANRLLAVEIPKPLVSRVTQDSRTKALRYLRDYAKENVARIRSEVTSTPTHRLGREHAHFSMLFMNACLALEPV